MASLTLKVKFTRSNQTKTLRFRAQMTVAEAIRLISQREVRRAVRRVAQPV